MALRNAAHRGGSLGAETMLALAHEPSDAARLGDWLRRGERLPGHAAGPRI